MNYKTIFLLLRMALLLGIASIESVLGLPLFTYACLRSIKSEGQQLAVGQLVFFVYAVVVISTIFTLSITTITIILASSMLLEAIALEIGFKRYSRYIRFGLVLAQAFITAWISSVVWTNLVIFYAVASILGFFATQWFKKESQYKGLDLSSMMT